MMIFSFKMIVSRYYYNYSHGVQCMFERIYFHTILSSFFILVGVVKEVVVVGCLYLFLSFVWFVWIPTFSVATSRRVCM
jgi:hypothetical protein